MNKYRNIKNKNDAVVGIVAAFLIVGLIVTVVSIIQTAYIPNWMEQQEAQHMEEVGNQFAELKYSIEQQMLTKQEGIPISTSITLGSKELPFLMSSRAFGTLTILPDQCTITIKNGFGEPTEFTLGVIKYSSANAYYLNQDYIYEAGGVILNQYQGNTMVIKPNFIVSNEDEVNIFFAITNISVIARKNTISGYGTYPIQTEYSNKNLLLNISGISSITITTGYPNAWHRFINRTLQNQGLNYPITPEDNSITIDMTGTKKVNIKINLVQIDAQVAPGWIENTKSSE